VQRGGRAWWRMTVPVSDVAALQRWLACERKALAALAHAEAQPLPAWHALGEGGAPAHYVQAVAQAVQRIQRGELVKVVLARRGAVAFDTAPSPPCCWRASVNATPTACATPGGAATRSGWAPHPRPWWASTAQAAHARAGRHAHRRTRRRVAGLGQGPSEHAIVVDAIRQALAPLTRALRRRARRSCAACTDWRTCTPPSRPRCAATSTSCAWCTRCTPRLPSAAVPAARAAALLAALEPEPRGLYAGPFLRLSPDGDCHAVVSLRGAVIDGRIAVLPAGAGIVEGSEGEAELAETRVKQGSVLDAFQGAA